MKKDWDRDGWVVLSANGFLLTFTFREKRSDAITTYMKHWPGESWRNISRRVGAKCIKAHLSDNWVNSPPSPEGNE